VSQQVGGSLHERQSSNASASGSRRLPPPFFPAFFVMLIMPRAEQRQLSGQKFHSKRCITPRTKAMPVLQIMMEKVELWMSLSIRRALKQPVAQSGSSRGAAEQSCYITLGVDGRGIVGRLGFKNVLRPDNTVSSCYNSIGFRVPLTAHDMTSCTVQGSSRGARGRVCGVCGGGWPGRGRQAGLQGCAATRQCRCGAAAAGHVYPGSIVVWRQCSCCWCCCSTGWYPGEIPSVCWATCFSRSHAIALHP